MSGNLEQFIDPALVYSFWEGPKEIRSLKDAKKDGLNCVALAHLALNALFDCKLPADEHCYEMYRDTERFSDIPAGSHLRQGDLVWFGRACLAVPEDEFIPQYDESGLLLNWRDSPVTHVAIATGETADGDDLLLHATHFEGTTALWPRAKFTEYARYGRECRVARLALGQVEMQQDMQNMQPALTGVV